VTLLLNRELVSRVKLCLLSVFPDFVKYCPEIRNLRKIFLRSFENVAPGLTAQPSRIGKAKSSYKGTFCIYKKKLSLTKLSPNLSKCPQGNYACQIWQDKNLRNSDLSSQI